MGQRPGTSGRDGLAAGLRRNPHCALLFTVALVLLCEGLRGSATLLSSPVWPTLQAAAAFAGLLLAWREQDRLKLGPVLMIGLAFQLGWIVLHLALGVQSDGDSSVVYRSEGHALLSGTYPSAEYPPGAVLLFALQSLLSGSAHGARVANAFLMVPWQCAAVVGIWKLDTGWSRWLAAVLAIWPLNAFFWEFKFDLAPTAALVVGLLLASRRRWGWAGVLLGVGAGIKWTPALAGISLGLWLLSRRQMRAAATHLLALAGTFLLINLPFLLTSPHALLAAYRRQNGRGISAESVFYLPPIIGPEHSIAIISHDVAAPDWANLTAGVVQVGLVLLMFVLATRVRALRPAVALAAMAPAVFLLSNRVFSPQYLVTIVAAWVLAGALLAESRRDQLILACLVFGATLSNLLVYPTGTTWWPTFTFSLFALGFGATGWLVARSLRLGAEGSR